LAALAAFGSKQAENSSVRTGLGAVTFASLGMTLLLSILEWHRGRGSNRTKHHALWTALLIVGTITIIVAVPWPFGSEREVRIDNRAGSGPYRVNHTCQNHTCFLYERTGPTIHSKKIARIEEGKRLSIVCQQEGELLDVDGRPASNIWDRLYNAASGPYVNDYFTDTPGVGHYSAGIPRC
jgi:hypothetical protein